MRQWKKWAVFIGTAVCRFLVRYICILCSDPVYGCRKRYCTVEKDGSFTGADGETDYKMQIRRQDRAAWIEFSVNETKKLYEVRWDPDNSRGKIFEDGALGFLGGVPSGGRYLAFNGGWRRSIL